MVITGDATNFRSWDNCSRIHGDLIIYRLEDTVTEETLEFLSSVEMVFGRVIVEDSPGLFSLSFLRNVRHTLKVVLKNNNNMFDARLPSISDKIDVFIDFCPNLCNDFYPSPELFDELTCTFPNLLFQTWSSIVPVELTNVYTVSTEIL